MKFHLETRELLADSYGRNRGRRMLTHAVMANEHNQATKVICGVVKLSSVCDGGANPLGLTAEPTCRRCRQKTRGMKFGR